MRYNEIVKRGAEGIQPDGGHAVFSAHTLLRRTALESGLPSGKVLFFHALKENGGEHVVKLTEKQKRFIDYYIETGNASEAARRAGYSEKIANRIGTENLSKPVIKEAITVRLKALEDKRIAKADEVLKFLTATLRGEVKDVQIVVEGTGDGCSKASLVETRASVRDRIKAAENLLKRYPSDMDVKEQRLKLAKLEQELKDAGQDDDNDVQIIDDIGADHEDHKTE
ncbi:MAG: terminase small subunit [Megasphaera elsdenii]|nr:terminase small subunit [Megasphaera elsdenii]